MKRFRMFAGPNGSGKSTLIEDVKKHYNVGYFVNADIIEKQLKTQGFINCEEYVPTPITQYDWENFQLNAENKQIDKQKLQSIVITDNILVLNTPIDSYIAASIANFFRQILLYTENTFSFETVMSHSSKVDFLKNVKKQGFKTYLYFVSTRDPKINIERIGLRVTKGGHNVLEKKVIERYYRSMELLFEAFMIADRAFIFDTTFSDKRSLLIEKKGTEMKILQDVIPEWTHRYLIEKIENI